MAASHNHLNFNYKMAGLDAAGKTTILYLGEVVTTIPTIGKSNA